MKALPMWAGLLLLTIAPVASHAELVTNGGFENPIVGSTGSQVIAAGSNALNGWTVAGNTGVTLLGNTPAYEGTQCLALNNLQPGTISQAINTVAGQLYTFSIAYRAASDVSTTTGQANVQDGSTVLLTKSMASNSSAWSTYSGSFTAASSSTSIVINGFFDLNANNLLVDAVSVNPTAVPEPGSLALCTLAGACLAAYGRNRLRRERASA